MLEYLPFYNDELVGLLESDLGIHEKYHALDRIRNILTDLRDDFAVMKSNINDPEDPEYIILGIVIDKVLRRIIATNKTINKLTSVEDINND